MIKSLLRSSLVVSMGFSSVLCWAAPFRNGGFEEPMIVGTQDYSSPANQLIVGWAVEGPELVSRLRGNAGAGGPDPAEGSQALCWNPGAIRPGMRIFQVFDTEPNARYEVSFRVGKRGFFGAVGVDAVVTDESSGEKLGCIAKYALSSSYAAPVFIFFQAKSVSTRLTFTDVSIEYINVDVLLDDVRVNQVQPRLEASLAIELKFSTESGKSYQLQKTDSLALPNWQNIGLPFAGTGEVASIYQSAVDPDLRIFRLIQASIDGTQSCEIAEASSTP